MKKFLVLLTVMLALAVSTTANAWHAVDVQATPACDVQTGTYNVTATIQQSSEWPGAFVKSVTPSSFSGTTTGSKSVTVVIGWTTSSETQTFVKYVSLAGTCTKVCEPATVERVVYVDRPVEVVREVIKEVPVEKVVEKPVVKTVVKWKTRVVVKWKTRTVVKRIIITKVVHDRCPPPPTCCVGKG